MFLNRALGQKAVLAIFLIFALLESYALADPLQNGVKGRLNPATMGAFKTSHFECRIDCCRNSLKFTMSGFQGGLLWQINSKWLW
jgi:hypothetical protein